MKTYSAFFKSNGEKIFEHIPGNKLWEMMPANAKLIEGGKREGRNSDGTDRKAQQLFDSPKGKFVIEEDDKTALFNH